MHIHTKAKLRERSLSLIANTIEDLTHNHPFCSHNNSYKKKTQDYMYIHPPWLHGAHMSGKCWMYVGHFVFMDIDAHQSLQEDGLVLRGSA